MPCSYYHKAKAIQSRVYKQNNNCSPSFGNTSMLYRIPTEQAGLLSIYRACVKHILGTTDCRVRTGYKT